MATHPFVGLNFLSARCKNIALPLFFFTGFLLKFITKIKS